MIQTGKKNKENLQIEIHSLKFWLEAKIYNVSPAHGHGFLHLDRKFKLQYYKVQMVGGVYLI